MSQWVRNTIFTFTFSLLFSPGEHALAMEYVLSSL